jgi:cell division transport system permease protein
VAVFLKEGLPEARAKALGSALGNLPSVSSIKYISADEALRELRKVMKDQEYILEGLEGNPLPASYELRLGAEAVTQDRVGALAAGIRGMEGVADVAYAEELLSMIRSVMSNADRAGVAIIALLASGVIFVCYSTVKILFYRKKDEIDTMKMLGATRWFIRTPFLIEGGAIGFGGGLAGACAMLLLHAYVYQRAAVAVPMLRTLAFPPEVLAAMALAGLLIGVIGAFIAVGRIRY